MGKGGELLATISRDSAANIRGSASLRADFMKRISAVAKAEIARDALGKVSAEAMAGLQIRW